MLLNIREYGDASAAPLVLLHGLFGSAANWGTVARALAPRYRVIVPDLRNHGQSPHHPVHDYPSMVGDLVETLDGLRIDRALLVGHSMGGKVAMHLALQYPARVAGISVVDMAPVAYQHSFDAVLAGFSAVDLAALRDRADADRQMATRIAGKGVRAFLLQNLVKQPDGWVWRLDLDTLAAAQRAITGFPEPPPGTRYDGPAAFIHGELSDYVRPSHRPRIRELFPQARLCQVAEAGHWVYADRPQGFSDCLDDFLARAVA